MNDDLIDWEKLLAYLDARTNKEVGDLTSEEADMLRFADRVRLKLRAGESEK